MLSVSLAFLAYEGLTRNVRVTYAERMPGVLGASTKFIDFMASHNNYIWSVYTIFIKQAFGESYHHYTPANCVCGRVYCFHVGRPSEQTNERTKVCP